MQLKFKLKTQIKIVIVSILLVFAAPIPAYAYIEPVGTSMILQLIVGAAVGFGVSAKIYWSKITSFFGKKNGRAEDSDSPVDENHK